jgi:hypothetical protein
MYGNWEGAEQGTGGKTRSPGQEAVCCECIMQPCVGEGSRAGGRPVCFEFSVIALKGGSRGGGEGGERVRQSERRPGRSSESRAWQGAGLSSGPVLYLNASTGVCLLTMMRSLAPACSFVSLSPLSPSPSPSPSFPLPPSWQCVRVWPLPAAPCAGARALSCPPRWRSLRARRMSTRSRATKSFASTGALLYCRACPCPPRCVATCSRAPRTRKQVC